jgi:hypothetical protein
MASQSQGKRFVLRPEWPIKNCVGVPQPATANARLFPRTPRSEIAKCGTPFELIRFPPENEAPPISFWAWKLSGAKRLTQGVFVASYHLQSDTPEWSERHDQSSSLQSVPGFSQRPPSGN